MASKYTKQQVMNEQRCGLKYLHRAIAHISKQELIDKGISSFKEDLPFRVNLNKKFYWSEIVSYIWHQALKICNIKTEPMSTWNLDEFFSDEEIKYIAEQLEITDPYFPYWERKV